MTFGSVLRITSIPTILALSVLAVAWMFAEYQNRKVFEQGLRAEVLSEVSLIRSRMENGISSNIQLVRGFIATLETEPDMTQERFASLASNLIDENSQIRNIAGAPDLVVQLMYPLKGNEAAIGLDYSHHETQRPAALRARDSGKLVLAGPVDLVQGGKGFIGRFPVFTSGTDGGRQFWGIVSAVIDMERLYRDVGLLDEDLSIDVALSGRDATGAWGDHFYGSPSVLEANAVFADVLLPSGSWQMAARPKAGWSVAPSNIWALRALMLLAGTLIMVPTVLSSRLIEERQGNISELKRRGHQLETLSRRLGLALDTSQIGVWEMNIHTNELFWDNRMNELYTYPADGGRRDYTFWEARLHPADLARAVEDFKVAIDARGPYQSEYRLVLPQGEIRHIRAMGTVYQDEGAPPRILGVNWDVTADFALNDELKRVNALTEARNAELESAKERIEHNALHDSLTGLPNRRYLDDILAEHAQKTGGKTETAALLQIDLDRFKQINDTLGHMAGDAMLLHAADVLRTTVEPRDFVARVGGDEFVIVRCWEEDVDGASIRELARLAESIIDRMQQPVIYQQHECRIGASIGIATDTISAADPMRLLVNADIALYRAKERGRNRYQFFNDALQAEIITTKRIADDILSGLEQNQFINHYQPQFDAETLEIVGVEALVRWKHPTRGLLAPNAFLKIAEELNVVATIDRLVLEQTLIDVHHWNQIGLNIPKASVNVSARRLQDDELVKNLRQMEIKPGTVAFELVESIFLDENDELLTWNVDQIKELGIDIEIDDFGTGYASIVSLMKLQPQRLKIDRQLVMPIVRSPGQRQLVGSIIDIGRSLGIEVLAEGVETMEHAQILRKLGCNALQGYAFARPMWAGDLIRFVQARRWREAS